MTTMSMSTNQIYFMMLVVMIGIGIVTSIAKGRMFKADTSKCIVGCGLPSSSIAISPSRVETSYDDILKVLKVTTISPYKTGALWKGITLKKDFFESQDFKRNSRFPDFRRLRLDSPIVNSTRFRTNSRILDPLYRSSILLDPPFPFNRIRGTTVTASRTETTTGTALKKPQIYESRDLSLQRLVPGDPPIVDSTRFRPNGGILDHLFKEIRATTTTATTTTETETTTVV